MPGMLQVAIITRQVFGQVPTFCSRCKEIKSFKIVRDDGSYTILCKCGCRLIQYHSPDDFHSTAFFTEKFIPKIAYDKNHKNKDDFERIGFEKKIGNGKVVYVK